MEIRQIKAETVTATVKTLFMDCNYFIGNDIMNALEIMGLGMAGIFAAIVIIMFFVWILQKMDGIGKKKKEEQK